MDANTRRFSRWGQICCFQDGDIRYVEDKNTALVDATFPAATATSNKTGTGKGGHHRSIDRFEDTQTAHTDYDADAAEQGWDFYPEVIEDTH